MIVEQKTYAQIIIIGVEDFIISSTYRAYESACPFLCFPGICATDFRASLREPEKVVANKDVILLLTDYWKLLSSDEKKAVLDHELGHIAKGHLKETAERIRSGNGGPSVVSEVKEKEADAYSAEMNGKPAMYNGLLKALDVIVEGIRTRGHKITAEEIIDRDHILKNRLEVLKSE